MYALVALVDNVRPPKRISVAQLTLRKGLFMVSFFSIHFSNGMIMILLGTTKSRSPEDIGPLGE